MLAGLMAALLISGYAYVRYAGNRELALALAETDRLDPYWRLEDLEAHRRPMPAPGNNGFEQALAAGSAMPAQPWPRPTFPQFDNDRYYQARVVTAMQKSLYEHDRMAPVLLNEEEARVLRAELERAKVTLALARQMVDFSSGRGPSIVPTVGSAAPVGPPYIKVLQASKTRWIPMHIV